MKSSNYQIKTMSLEELKLAASWAAQEGWNPGLKDAECYYQADPNGFLMGFLNGEPIASISVVNYQNIFGFLGFYIVKPEYRGQGYGYALWQAGMEYLKGMNVGLDGVVAQQENYQKSGFKLAYRNIRYEGIAAKNLVTSSHIVLLEDVPFAELEDYESAFFPCKRTGFLKSWISEPQHTALAFVDKGLLKGYMVVRPCQLGFKLGPLFADSKHIAQSLFDAACNAIGEGSKIYLDVPEVNPLAMELASQNNMQACFETARMYTGSIPDLDTSRIYGVTSFEIG